jgi:DNA-binding response OmpR family regulator
LQANSQALPGKRVLVVEDEYLIGADIRGHLESAGASTVLVANCAEALRVLQRTEFELAVLDIKLGDETCYPVAEELRRRGMPFIFVTGYDVARKDFADAPIFLKPCSPQAVIGVLAELARRSKAA